MLYSWGGDCTKASYFGMKAFGSWSVTLTGSAKKELLGMTKNIGVLAEMTCVDRDYRRLLQLNFSGLRFYKLTDLSIVNLNRHSR